MPARPRTQDSQDSTGRVVAAYGRSVVVEDPERQRHRCTLRGRKLRPVCTDDVTWHQADTQGAEGIVTAVLPRRSELARPDSRGRTEVIAANMTQIVVVVAPRPEPDFGLVDRYLVAAELSDVAAVIVANKNDLGTLRLGEFAAIGYATVSVSAKQQDSLAPLSTLLAGQTSIFVGQSGVGKSSLLNTLIPGLDIRTQTLSEASGEGRHTTTASVLHHLDNGGEVIDSPGVRDFAPPPVDEAQLARGFREFRDLAPSCRFHNCRHLAEPGCAVKEAAGAGKIHQRRYASYSNLIKRLSALSDPDYS